MIVIRELRRVRVVALSVVCAWACSACTVQDVDLSTVKRPGLASELAAYNVFIGQWNWEAEALNASPSSKNWKGTANWRWSLDGRCLSGDMSAKSDAAEYEASGVWSWHPTKKQYIWWMFNNWGYPQEGTANYDEDNKTWRMDYTSVGLDGTTSYGSYEIKVVTNDELDWHMSEWADSLRTVKKIEMKGTYRRR